MAAQSPAIYDTASSRPRALVALADILRSRDLVLQLVRRDILTRYKRSVLGLAWTSPNPLGMMLIFTAVFSQLFGGPPASPAYVLSGLVAWNFFAQTTTISMTQLVWGSALLHRIFVPKAVFAVSSIGTGLVNLGLSLVPLFGIMLLIGAPLRATVLFLPVAILFLAMFTLGVGLLLSMLAVFFPDVSEMYQIVLLAWFYLTPVIYPVDIVPGAFRQLLLLNPMYHLITLFRMPIYEGVLPSVEQIAIGAAIASVALLGGWIAFSKKADEFAYY